ncbi:MAG: PrsW family glutamic-type intramembrane protease, partial [Bacteroidales bacterium]|nr:PrsW family glutamic-type intramembrane protease [Bacteroidales bacterium]
MKIVIALLPVVVFLLFLIWMDSFKLVKIPDLVVCVLWGMLCAAGAYFINTEIMNGMDIGKPILSRDLAPIVEETLKIFVIILLIWKNRIGFMIDGAIYGFGVG